MHQSIDSYFHIVPCISKLNPKKNWILLTTLGITIMFDFLIKVKIFKILLNVLTIVISCITFLSFKVEITIIHPKKFKKFKIKFASRGV